MLDKFEIWAKKDGGAHYYITTCESYPEAEKYILGQRHVWADGEQAIVYRVRREAVMTVSAAVKLTKRDL